ncbi:MAG TPA: Plug domain-containing protein, partial [Edaphobacter sp.]|nr:Plug domain-containing protein [Edaphobacter sp.]
MKIHPPHLLLCFLYLSAATAQPPQQAPPQTKPAPIAQSITVTTTLEPLPLAESDRSVNLISPRDQPLISNSVVDLLRQDSSLNLQARAPNGVQADLSLRGTTFEQSLILLNGLRINDPETG